jgi:hypothetical protein
LQKNNSSNFKLLLGKNIVTTTLENSPNLAEAVGIHDQTYLNTDTNVNDGINNFEKTVNKSVRKKFKNLNLNPENLELSILVSNNSINVNKNSNEYRKKNFEVKKTKLENLNNFIELLNKKQKENEKIIEKISKKNTMQMQSSELNYMNFNKNINLNFLNKNLCCTDNNSDNFLNSSSRKLTKNDTNFSNSIISNKTNKNNLENISNCLL